VIGKHVHWILRCTLLTTTKASIPQSEWMQLAACASQIDACRMADDLIGRSSRRATFYSDNRRKQETVMDIIKVEQMARLLSGGNEADEAKLLDGLRQLTAEMEAELAAANEAE